MDWIASTWDRYPNWVRWPVVVTLALVAYSLLNALGERDVVAGAVQIFAATVLRYGMIAIAIGAGYFVGRLIYKRFGNALAALGFGMLIGLTIAAFGSGALRSLPGVGWRIEAMDNSDCYVDWDGRSNPTVCD